MDRLQRIGFGLIAVLATAATAKAQDAAKPATAPPNVIVILIDDMGYADIGPFGAEGHTTPNLDKMAQEGRRFTDFVVSSAVCSASRAGLMTGAYHTRVGINGALSPRSDTGLHEGETTLAELCQFHGYATAAIGKWHLGHHPKFLPTNHGFDYFYGLPYSNDMWPAHPANVARLKRDPKASPLYPSLPLLEGTRVIDPKVTAETQAELTQRYTKRAVEFIEKNHDRPFFLYLPHTMVHVPIYASKAFAGKSGRGTYADVVMELDWSVGEVLAAVRRTGIDRNTLVIFTSDNGPWLSYGDHAGSVGVLREGKGTMFEGGYRTPTLMRWPGKIPAGTTCDELASTIDILPTVAALIGAELPENPIDGKDIRPLMFGEPGAESPHEAFYCYYGNNELQAIRDRRWKLHFPHTYRTLAGQRGGTGGEPVPYQQARIGLSLFDLKKDFGERKNVAAEHPEVVARLTKAAEAARERLGDRLTSRRGTENRPAGRLEEGDERLTW